jgi:hypothetical protein
MRIDVFGLAFLSCTLLATPAGGQEPRYWGPDPDDTFFPIGWSDDGRQFAFGWFETTQMISNGSQITLIVQDIVTDDVLGAIGRAWDEGNVGPPGDPCPRTAAAAWELVAAEGDALLEGFDIWGGTGAGLLRFPMQGEHAVEIEIREGGPGHTVHAIKRDAGSPEPQEKRISADEEYANDVSVVGYVPSPDSSRIAVVLRVVPFDRPFSEYRVVGCHLTAGFGK